MERRFINQAQASVRLEKRAENEKAMIVGMAALYYDGTPKTEYVLWDDQWGRAVERIMPGAFDGALSRPDDVRGLFNHDTNHVLGRTAPATMRLRSDTLGLHYEIDPGETSVARDVSEHLRRKDVTGSSFGFTIEKQQWIVTEEVDGRMNEIREIHSVNPLWDVGPVTFPAYEQTTAGVRSAEGIAELRRQREAEHRARAENREVDDLKLRMELAERA